MLRTFNVSSPSTNWFSEYDEYHITENNFNVGDWVSNTELNSISQIKNIMFDTNSLDVGKYVWCIDKCKKWKPREGELCVFWNSLPRYMVSRFEGYNGYHYIDVYKDEFVNIAPLEFIQTLKDS